MSPAPYRFLRWLFIGIGIAYVIAISVIQFIYPSRFSGISINPVTTPNMWWHDYILSVLVISIGVMLALRLQKPSYHIFLAAFLVIFGCTYSMYRVWAVAGIDSVIFDVIIGAVAGALFIYSMIRFSGKHSAAEYRQYFLRRKRPEWYKKAVIFFSNDKAFWFIFFPALFGLTLAGTLVPPVIAFIINIVILMVGLVYFRISFFFAGSENRNKLAWLLWGLIVTIGLYLVQLFLAMLYYDLMLLRFIILLLNSLVIVFSFSMSIFFFRSTDARFVVRKTLIYGAIFLAGLFVFGAVEHYVIHTIAHALHIQSSILNSCFGAAIALMIRPLHHKVEHWLGRRGKQVPEHH
jgi:hypothetical protein